MESKKNSSSWFSGLFTSSKKPATTTPSPVAANNKQGVNNNSSGDLNAFSTTHGEASPSSARLMMESPPKSPRVCFFFLNNKLMKKYRVWIRCHF